MDTAMVDSAKLMARKLDERREYLEVKATAGTGAQGDRLFRPPCPECGATDGPCTSLRSEGKPIKREHKNRPAPSEVLPLGEEGGGITYDLQQLTVMLTQLGLTPAGRSQLNLMDGSEEEDELGNIIELHASAGD